MGSQVNSRLLKSYFIQAAKISPTLGTDITEIDVKSCLLLLDPN